jgi:hypothetical protein
MASLLVALDARCEMRNARRSKVSNKEEGSRLRGKSTTEARHDH